MVTAKQREWKMQMQQKKIENPFHPDTYISVGHYAWVNRYALRMHPLWTLGSVDLNHPSTIGWVAAQARLLGESTSEQDMGGWASARARRLDFNGIAAHSIAYVVPLSKGWRIRGVNDFVEGDTAATAAAERVYCTEGDAWAAAWVLMAQFAVDVFGVDATRARMLAQGSEQGVGQGNA